VEYEPAIGDRVSQKLRRLDRRLPFSWDFRTIYGNTILTPGLRRQHGEIGIDEEVVSAQVRARFVKGGDPDAGGETPVASQGGMRRSAPIADADGGIHLSTPWHAGLGEPSDGDGPTRAADVRLRLRSAIQGAILSPIRDQTSGSLWPDTTTPTWACKS
jgi:hypothetical protein